MITTVTARSRDAGQGRATTIVVERRGFEDAVQTRCGRAKRRVVESATGAARLADGGD
jgi:hypothetical protein